MAGISPTYKCSTKTWNCARRPLQWPASHGLFVLLSPLRRRRRRCPFWLARRGSKFAAANFAYSDKDSGLLKNAFQTYWTVGKKKKEGKEEEEEDARKNIIEFALVWRFFKSHT